MKNLLLFFGLLSLMACGPSTKIEKSWREPSAVFNPGPDQKVLVIGMVKDEASRRIVEDNMVKRMAVTAVQSYTIIDNASLKSASVENLDKELSGGGFTHVLLVRLAEVENETSYVPGTGATFYGGYGRFYGYGSGFYGEPGYYATDKNYFIESAVYTVNPDKLIYTATTKTVNPSKLDKTINEVADAVIMQMKKDGFVIKPAKK